MKRILLLLFLSIGAIGFTQNVQEVPISPAFAPEYIDLTTNLVQDMSFTIPESESLLITLYPATDLVLQLTLPSGDVVSPANAASFGATFAQETLPQNQLFLPSGEVQLVALETPVAGEYSLRIDATGSASAQSNGFVIVEPSAIGVASGSVKTGLSVLGPNAAIEVGEELAVTALVFEDTQGLAGATVTGRIVDTAGQEVAPLSFRDDGAAPDDVAGDGLYSSTFATLQPGTYVAIVDISAQSSSGLTFGSREIAEFTVFPANLHLTGAFSDQGADTDGDGFVDEVQLTFETSGVATSGSYSLHVFLEANSGLQTDARVTGLNLAGGDSPTVVFGADALRSLGVDGPYLVKTVVFMYEKRLLDRLDDLGNTAAYQLSGLERDNTLVSPLLNDTAVDTDGDGLFDLLNVTFSVDVLLPGSYGISANLQAENGATIDVAGLASVSLSQGSQEVTLSFSGLRIGASNLDGPYLVTNLLVYPRFGARATAIVNLLGETQAYACSAFVGCVVDVDFDDLITFIDALGIEVGLKNSLLSKAENARAAFERGSIKAADNILSALLNEVSAQRGKGLSEADADEITDMVTTIQDSLE